MRWMIRRAISISARPYQERCRRISRVVPGVAVLAGRQGLTLVHLSAQLEPCPTQENTLHTLKQPLIPP
jgi:hypothetical protein